MKEATLENDILQYLAYTGGVWFRTHDAKHKPCTSGIPDIIGCRDGQFVGIEVKRPGQKANAVQLDTLARIRHAGGRGFVAASLADAQEGIR